MTKTDTTVSSLVTQVKISDVIAEKNRVIADLRAKLAEAEKDAARYLWLRDYSANQFEHPIVVSQHKKKGGMNYLGPVLGKNLDESIDAAMQQVKG